MVPYLQHRQFDQHLCVCQSKTDDGVNIANNAPVNLCLHANLVQPSGHVPGRHSGDLFYQYVWLLQEEESIGWEKFSR